MDKRLTCPVCGSGGVWEKWIVIPKNEIRKDEWVEWALHCECYHTGYWPDKNKTFYNWQRYCQQTTKECLL